MKEFTLRTKAQRLPEAAISSIKTILDMEKEEARKFLWNAWCDPASISSGMGLALAEADAQLWVNELRYQFETLYPEKTLGSEKAFQQLSQVTNNFVATEIRGKILEYGYRDINSIRRAGYLLKSDWEKLYFGGLRELGFSKADAERLKEFHEQISALFEECMTNKYSVEYTRPEADKPKTADNPKPVDDQKVTGKVSLTTKPKDTNKVAIADKPKSVDKENKVAPTDILANIQLIEQYYSIVEQLEKAGVAPALLESRKNAIKDLITASKLFG